MASSEMSGFTGWLKIFCLLLVFCQTYGTDTEGGVHKFPQTSLKTLSDFVDGNVVDASFLHDVGGKVGTFAVTGLGSEFAAAIEEFRKSAPECLENFDSHLPVSDMADGSRRRTFATQVRVPAATLKSFLSTYVYSYKPYEGNGVHGGGRPRIRAGE